MSKSATPRAAQQAVIEFASKYANTSTFSGNVCITWNSVKSLNVKMCKFSKKNPEDGFPELLLLLYVVSCATLLVRIFRGEKLPAQSGSYREYFMSIGFAGFLLDLSCVYWFNWFILVLLSISLVLLVFN